jgi:hypothetical protein
MLILITTSIYSEYTEKKIPKPEIRKFDTLKISDLTQRVQLNTAVGGNIWLWNNLNDSSFTFKIDEISIGVDKYFLFYNGITSKLLYNLNTSLTSISLGYKLKLYEFFYTKFELESIIYPSFDLGFSASVGIEFSIFNLLRIFTYTDFTSFLINGNNLTTVYLDYYIGLGIYF